MCVCVCVCETAPLSPVTPDHPPPSPRLAADLVGGTLRSMVCCMTGCQFNCMSDIVSILKTSICVTGELAAQECGDE
jgi:hypothetical protein